MALLLRTEIMSLEEIQRAIDTAHAASFLDRLLPSPEFHDDRGTPADLHAPIALEVEV
jgi:hypothetical protein